MKAKVLEVILRRIGVGLSQLRIKKGYNSIKDFEFVKSWRSIPYDMMVRIFSRTPISLSEARLVLLLERFIEPHFIIGGLVSDCFHSKDPGTV